MEFKTDSVRKARDTYRQSMKRFTALSHYLKLSLRVVMNVLAGVYTSLHTSLISTTGVTLGRANRTVPAGPSIGAVLTTLRLQRHIEHTAAIKIIRCIAWNKDNGYGV